MRRLIFIFTITVFISACRNENDISETSFYYWKTIFRLNKTEMKVLTQNKVKILYIRYFDIDLLKDGITPVPVSPVQFEQKPDFIEVVPVVYIKNIVLKNKDINIQKLATKILYLVNQINKINNLNNNEIQIDCDWSLDSRENYMNFIEEFRKIYHQKLSVTIRLHQVKYFYKTKVPNADYGVLMYYNMGKIAADSLNSIYDEKIAGKYINSLKNYPLDLDFALPIFTNIIQIRNNKIVNLINKIDHSGFTNDTNFVQISENRIRVKNSVIKYGFYFKQNDQLKIESVNFKDLKEMAFMLSKKLAKKPGKILFFDLDSINLKSYYDENKNFSEITDCF